MDFSALPTSLRYRFISRAGNHEGFSAIDMFNAIPDHLKDSFSEINYWLDTHQWSHKIPGGDEAIWETIEGFPNQSRGARPMTEFELEQIQIQNKLDANNIESFFSDDISTNIYDAQISELIPLWSESLNQAFAGAGLFGGAGYCVAFAFRVGREVVSNREQLQKSREFRKSFFIKTLERAHKEGFKAGSIAFIVSFICTVFPPFQFLVSTALIVGLGKLGLELLSSVVNQVDPNRTSFLSTIFDFTRHAFNFAAAIFSRLWVVLDQFVDWAAAGIKKAGNQLLRIGKKIFQKVSAFMNWLLGNPGVDGYGFC